MNSGTRRWCFADQLGPDVRDDPNKPVLLIESRAVFERRRFHRRKTHLVLSALRHRAAELGDQALFLQTRTYREALDRNTKRLTGNRRMSRPLAGMQRLGDLDEVVAQQRRLGDSPP